MSGASGTLVINRYVRAHWFIGGYALQAGGQGFLLNQLHNQSAISHVSNQVNWAHSDEAESEIPLENWNPLCTTNKALYIKSGDLLKSL